MQLSLARIALLLLAAGTVGTALVGAASGDTLRANPVRPIGDGARFTAVYKSPIGLEGLTGDRAGNLYSPGRGADPCPIFRVKATGGPTAVVGSIPAPCGPTGLAFDRHGRLYVADDDQIHVLTPSADSPPTATVFASGVPGANGVAFDRRGDLWVSDGGTAQGRVWRIGANGVPTEMFRVQPLTNDVNLVAGVGGVGRDARSVPPGTVTITPTGRQAANTLGSQHLVANGLAFTDRGDLLVGDTGRGAIWKIDLDRDGSVRSPVGCDSTFTANTLCLDNVLVAHPYLEGTDGIAVDRQGNVWVAANERNAVVVVTRAGRVLEFFRSPASPSTRLRNEGPLEFPTSPFLAGRTLCLTHSDGNRRDNSPNTAGEVTPAGPERAKISCLEQQLPAAGLEPPVD